MWKLPLKILEDQAHGQRREHGERAGQNHLLERGAGNDAHAAAIVRLGGARHDAGVLAELRAHIFNDVLRGAADSLDGEGGEEKDQHRAQQRPDKDRHTGQVDVGKAPAGGRAPGPASAKRCATMPCTSSR